ncbi:MAG: FG-GAP repeat protein, partial [Gammaproteobacteria bacterium]
MYRTRLSRPGCSFLMLLIALPLALRDAGAGTRPPERLVEQEAPPPGLSSLPIQAQASISAALGRDQRAYHAKRDGRAGRLDNPKHGLRADFTTRGLEMRSGAARFGLRLIGLGRGARLEAVIADSPEAQANRVEYRRGGLSEWYVNGPLGLEQGFTLDSPPARKGSEALTLALRLSGDLSAVPDPRGDGMALQARGGGTALRYRGLVAWDSTGRTLPAWWQGQGSEVRLRVDDSGAGYPLTIDPIFEDARLTASDGATGDAFGFSVAVSGETVVVGAVFDDVGSNLQQGSAYVFVRPVGGWAG